MPSNQYRPLADELRPTELDEVVGQSHILGPDGLLRRIIESGQIPNMIFYGPSGTGKTTVARIIAEKTNRALRKLNATTAGLADIRAVIDVMDPGPVRDELSRVVAEVTIGTSLAAALNNVAARVGTNEANAVFSTLAQSLEMGTSVAENLQSAAQLIRHSARVRAQAQAQKAVVNMSFPLLLLILPGVFIVLFAPLVIQYINR